MVVYLAVYRFRSAVDIEYDREFFALFKAVGFEHEAVKLGAVSCEIELFGHRRIFIGKRFFVK